MPSGTIGFPGSIIAGDLIKLHGRTANFDASLNFTSFIDASLYSAYLFKIVNMVPVSNNVDFAIRVSNDNGATYDSRNNYVLNHYLQATSGNVVVVATTSSFKTRNNPEICNIPARALCGNLEMYEPSSPTAYKRFGGNIRWSGAWYWVNTIFDGTYISSTPINAVKFYFSTGNIASGSIYVYGIKG